MYLFGLIKKRKILSYKNKSSCHVESLNGPLQMQPLFPLVLCPSRC